MGTRAGMDQDGKIGRLGREKQRKRTYVPYCIIV